MPEKIYQIGKVNLNEGLFMKKILKNKIVILFSVIVVIAVSLFAGISGQEKMLTNAVMVAVQKLHYNPKTLNDKFSEEVFRKYLDQLDYGKRFFLQSDIEHLAKYKFEIDNELRKAEADFYEEADKIFMQRVNQVNDFYQEILAEPFDYFRRDSLETDYDKSAYCNSSEELYNRWEKILQYQTTVKYINLAEEGNKIKEKNAENIDTKTRYLVNGTLIDSLEAKARKKIAERTKRVLNYYLKKTEEERYADYLNSVIAVFDPHSNYFPPKDKEDFDIRMTGKFEGIGASLSQENGYTKVEEIIPGSASFRQGELQPQDIILKVAQGDEEAVDVVDMPLRDVVKLIRGKKGTEVRLTVKKPDNSIVIIPIIRDEVILEETYAKAAVINRAHKDIGYIQLLKFYRDFNNNNARNATKDIKAALKMMDKTDGLILDLRNNGGGALTDAIDIAGLFIESGPIVQVKGRENRKKVYQDSDPAVYYQGPLVVLVNKFSASASEILAAALQDYNRAVIIGSSQTFGKGTVQTIFDLNRLLPFNFGNDKGIGALKITFQKFYRANGGSTQAKGVASDIVLPDVYDYMEVGESKLDFALPWDTTQVLNFKKWHFSKHWLDKLREKSRKRIEKNKAFKMVEKYSDDMKKAKENSLKSLHIESIIADQTETGNDSKKIDKFATEMKDAKISFIEYHQRNKSDDDDKKMEEWFKNIKKDIYIREATNVLFDMFKEKIN